MFFEPHYQAIHSPADDLRGLDPQALTRLFKRSNGMVRYEKQNGREREGEILGMDRHRYISLC